ncbi:MAG: alcohol dehydrogenase catalytic domain-containing protein [Deltaproteobacteria bacterium]|nr:MAG: alcohol dehydrogenase catalytic domain-containing protein [Deltaproteobacteria bacterium]
MSERRVPVTMRAAVWAGGSQVKVETVPVPKTGSGELLVQVEACGLCPTDIKKIDMSLAEPPIILGHEMAGVVVGAGKGAEEFLDKRVAVYHHMPCLQCRLCELGRYSQCAGYKKTGTTAGFSPAGGGWAEYVKVSSWIVTGGGVVEIPQCLPVKVAILMEPLNTCLKCLEVLPSAKGRIVILGQGPVGLMLTALARRDGWEVVTVEPLPDRREISSRLGAKTVLRPGKGLTERLRQAAEPLGPDAAIAATESEETINATLRALRPGGTLVLFAHTRPGQELTIDAGQIGVLEKQVVGSYSSSIELNSRVMEILLDESLPWEEFVTHVFPLSEISGALALAKNPGGGSLKVAVAPNPDNVTEVFGKSGETNKHD